MKLVAPPQILGVVAGSVAILGLAGCATNPWAMQNYLAVVVQARKVDAASVVETSQPTTRQDCALQAE
jgi:hypothetical protein